MQFTLTECFERCADVQFALIKCFAHCYLEFSLSFFLDSLQTWFIERLHSLSEEEVFIEAFRMGARMILDVIGDYEPRYQQKTAEE